MQLLLTMPVGAEWLLVILVFSTVLAFAGFWIYTILDVIKNKFVDESTKIVWLLVVILLGFLGAIIYWVVGRSNKVTVNNSYNL